MIKLQNIVTLIDRVKKYLAFLIFGVLLVFFIGFFGEQVIFLFRGKSLNLNSENKVEFKPSINVTSEIPGLEILLSDNFEKTVEVWNKKLAIGEYRKNYNVKIYSSDLVEMDNSLDSISLAEMDKTYYEDGKSVLWAFGLYKKNETDLPIEVSIYISKKYLFDRSIEFSEKNRRINNLIFRGIVINSSERRETLLTETENNNLNELFDSRNLPFEIKLYESYLNLNENWQGFVKKMSELFSLEIAGKVYACGDAPYGFCADHGTWETPYYCNRGGGECTPGGDPCPFNGSCVAGTAVCVRLMAWSNECGSVGSCDVCCDCCVPDWPDPLCTTACGVAGHWVYDGCGNSHWCDATSPCCTISNPDTPVLSAPATGTKVNVNTSVNLDWDAISSWGNGCPNSDKYQVCVMSGSTCDLMNWTDVASTTTIKSWTPTSGDSSVTWKVRSNNGSRTTESLTRTLCVEDELCSIKCGQATKCSGNCANTDGDLPGVPVINYPVGTSLSPVVLAGGTTGITLSLGGTASKADLYYYGIYKNGTYSYGLNSTNPVINVGITGLTTGVTYSWRARSLNNTCIPYSGGVGVTSAASSFGYFRVNSLPTFTSLIIKNADSGVVVGQAGGSTSRNHICQSTFQNSISPRRVIFEASVSDADGASDIGSTGAVLKWNGKLYTMTKVGSPVGVGATMRATVDFGVGDNSSGTYDLFVTVTDIYGGTSGEVNTNRDFKVWDCQVPVSGTLFQAPDGVQVCSTNSVGIGFSIPIEDKVGFESITFSDTPNVVLTDDDLDSYGSPNNVIWGKTYLPLINGGDASNIDGTLLATGRQTRIIDIGVGTTTCSAASQFTIDDARVSPYSATPRAQVDFSFIQDQESWYQVSFAGIRAKSSLTYGVPYTAPDSSRFLTLGNSTTDNGLVSAISFTNINGNNNNEFGSPKNWWINKNISGIQNYSYDYFYNNLFLKKGIGSTGTTWNQRPSSGIFFVSGNLSINSNQVSSTPPLVIVRGGIDITTDVTQLDGIYIADGNISIGGTSASALNVNGSLYAGGNIRMYRSFTNKTINNTTPAVKVNYNPGLIMRLPVDMVKVLSNWRSE